ncbi:MAG: TlpA family protein disulfide reductase [Proteobacteria bacterium]|nr:TlpA family protein disulfide reductase [Pseudomonadota bacterium]
MLVVGTAAAVVIAAAWLIEHAATALIANRANPTTSVPAISDLVSVSAGTSGVPLLDHPRAVPDIRFADGDGRARSLADFRSKVVLLNVWATWCGPCREEMPTLDRLQATLGGPRFEVVALSIDRAGPDVVRKFFGEIGVENLALYIDSTGKASRDLAIVGLPTTLLIDAEGREIGRLIGPAKWDAPEMVTFLRSRLPGETGSLTPGSSNGRRDGAAVATRRHGGGRLADLDHPVTGNTTSPISKEGASS